MLETEGGAPAPAAPPRPAVLLLTLLAAALPQGGPPTPNVLVVLMDDVGRDKVQAYGEQPAAPPTPNLDALAARGVLFRNAWAYHSCSPTRAALLTGRHADRTGIGSVIRTTDGVHTPLALSEVTLPEALPGYTSVALGKWHLLDAGDPETHPLDSGFHAVSGFLGPNDYHSWSWNLNGTLIPRTGYYPADLAGQVTGALERTPEPFFLYYCPRLAHAPFHVPPQSLHSQGHPTTPEGQHEAMSEAMDTIIGRLLDTVDLESTYVFVIGDNGSPGETVVPPFQPTRGKGTLYEGGVRSSLVVWGPGLVRGHGGVNRASVFSAIDLVPSLLQVTGTPRPDGADFDGEALAPTLLGQSDASRSAPVFFRRPPDRDRFYGVDDLPDLAVRAGRYKLMCEYDGSDAQLFDLEADVGEQRDVSSKHPEVVASLRSQLLAWHAEMPPDRGAELARRAR